MSKNGITPEDFYHIVEVSDPRLSPDGQWVAFVRQEVDRVDNTYRRHIWLARSDGSAPPRQFTNGPQSDTSPRWSPDGRWLAFVSQRGGDEAKAQIYLIRTDGGEARAVTEMENGAADPAWSPGGRFIAFTSRVHADEMAAEDEPEPEAPLDADERKRRSEEKKKREKEKADPRVVARFMYRAGTEYLDDRTAQIYLAEIDPDTGDRLRKPQRLTSDPRNYQTPRWLPNGAALLATVNRQPGEDDLFYYPDIVRVPLDGSGVDVLTTAETADADPRPSPNGRWIAHLSQLADRITTANIEIWLRPTDGGAPRLLTGELDRHASNLRWAADGRSLYFLVPDRGRVDLRRVSIEGGPVETVLTADRELLSYDLSTDDQTVAFVASTDRFPSDLFVADLETDSERRLTEVNAGWLAERALGQTEDLWFQSADGTPIQGWLVKPPGFDPAQTYPLALEIHGGPHVMWSRHERTLWHEWQTLAARGYVVFACNPRGSDGYGQAFREALLNAWGDADLPDLQAGISAVLATGFVDPQRMAVTGGSYGGFMTAWVISHDDHFQAAVAQRGVYDMISFYSTSDIPRLMEWEFYTTPWEDPSHLWQRSPLAYVEQIRTPLLLIHSDNDFRAPVPSAEGLFVALRRLKRTVEMVRYPREGHELSRSGEPKHRVDRLRRIVDWFDTYCQPEHQDVE